MAVRERGQGSRQATGGSFPVPGTLDRWGGWAQGREGGLVAHT